MRRTLALIICLWLAGTSPAAVTIDAPVGPVPVGQFVVLDLDGTAVAPQVLLTPKSDNATVDIGVHMGAPCVVFWASQAGEYGILVIASDRRAPLSDEYAGVVVVAGQPEPDPKPDPEPKPKPDPPPPPAERLRVQIVWEWQERLPIEQYRLFHSVAVEEWLEAGGHDLKRRDVDSVDADDKPVVDPRPETLPVVRIYDADTGGLLWEGLPADEADFLAKLQGLTRSPVAAQSSADGPLGLATPSTSAGAAPCPICPPKVQPQPRSQPTYRRGVLRR